MKNKQQLRNILEAINKMVDVDDMKWEDVKPSDVEDNFDSVSDKGDHEMPKEKFDKTKDSKTGNQKEMDPEAKYSKVGASGKGGAKQKEPKGKPGNMKEAVENKYSLDEAVELVAKALNEINK